jgi:hypothetical protein
MTAHEKMIELSVKEVPLKICPLLLKAYITYTTLQITTDQKGKKLELKHDLHPARPSTYQHKLW